MIADKCYSVKCTYLDFDRLKLFNGLIKAILCSRSVEALQPRPPGFPRLSSGVLQGNGGHRAIRGVYETYRKPAETDRITEGPDGN